MIRYSKYSSSSMIPGIDVGNASECRDFTDTTHPQLRCVGYQTNICERFQVHQEGEREGVGGGGARGTKDRQKAYQTAEMPSSCTLHMLVLVLVPGAPEMLSRDIERDRSTDFQMWIYVK